MKKIVKLIMSFVKCIVILSLGNILFPKYIHAGSFGVIVEAALLILASTYLLGAVVELIFNGIVLLAIRISVKALDNISIIVALWVALAFTSSILAMLITVKYIQGFYISGVITYMILALATGYCVCVED